MQPIDRKFTIHRVPGRVILPLRAAVLRPSLPLAEAVFPHDQASETLHLAALTLPGLGVGGCLTLRPEMYRDGRAAYRLRGMAVAQAVRGMGAGRQLLTDAVRRVACPLGPQLLWCNARTSVLGFYQRVGWRIDSDEFDIPTAGPHRRMVLDLPNQRPSR